MVDISSPYFPIIIAFIISGSICAIISIVAFFLGPKKPTQVKLDTYECGIPVQANSARTRISVKFYLTALLFILFDIETVFLYLWAVAFNTLGWFGVIEAFLFISTLLIGYVYILKRGALRWE